MRRLALAFCLLASSAFAQTGSRDYVPDDYAETDTAATAAVPATLFVWANVDASASYVMLSVVDKAEASHGIWLQSRLDGDLRVRCRISDGVTEEALSTQTMSVGAWENMGCVYASSTEIAAWLHGLENYGTHSAVSPNAFDRTSVGRFGSSSPGSYTNGKIAGVAIWSIGLSDPVMRALSVGYSPQYFPGGLVGWWPSMGSGAVSLLDKSGAGLDLTLQDTPPTSANGPPVFYPTPGGQ